MANFSLDRSSAKQQITRVGALNADLMFVPVPNQVSCSVSQSRFKPWDKSQTADAGMRAKSGRGSLQDCLINTLYNIQI